MLTKLLTVVMIGLAALAIYFALRALVAIAGSFDAATRHQPCGNVPQKDGSRGVLGAGHGEAR